MSSSAARAVPPGTSVRVRVPASSANLGPGFDSVGLALGLWDTCEVVVVERPGLTVSVAGEGAGVVPLDGSHLVVRTMRTAWRELGVPEPTGLVLDCVNAVPHGRGLGSSATAIVTGILAAHGLAAAGVARTVDIAAVNDLAGRLEGHPDNASASVFGGITLSWSDAPGVAGAIRTVRFDPHPDLGVVVLVPAAQLSTAKARSVLPPQVGLADAAANSARTALLVHALTQDPGWLLPATRDWLHQEARRDSYAASMALVDRLRADGHAAVISGAGPSVLVLGARSSCASVRVEPDQWRRLEPGIPALGAQVERGGGHAEP